MAWAALPWGQEAATVTPALPNGSVGDPVSVRACFQSKQAPFLSGARGRSCPRRFSRERFKPSWRSKIAIINALLPRLEDETSVTFLDIGERFLDDRGRLPQTLMPDYVHPSTEDYRVLGDAIRQPVEYLLNAKVPPRRLAKGALQRVDACRGRLIMWVSVGGP